MTNEPLRSTQRETLLQQLKGQPTASAMLQMQQAQMGQLGKENSGAAGTLAAPSGDQYLIFMLQEREFAVKADFVQGVERLSGLTPVPNVVSWVKGIMNLRGVIVSLVDLRAFLELDPLPYTARTRLLSLQYNEMVICFIVDSISEMLVVPSSAIINGSVRQSPIPTWAAPYAAGIALLSGNRAVVLLDVARLIFSDKMQHYEI